MKLIKWLVTSIKGFPAAIGEESASQCTRHRKHRFHPWSRKWHPIPVFLPRKFYGQRSPAAIVWHAAVHGVTKSQTQLSNWTTTKRIEQNKNTRKLHKNKNATPHMMSFLCVKIFVLMSIVVTLWCKMFFLSRGGDQSVFKNRPYKTIFINLFSHWHEHFQSYIFSFYFEFSSFFTTSIFYALRPSSLPSFLISVESRNSSCFHEGDKWSIPFFCQLNLYWSILQTPPNLKKFMSAQQNPNEMLGHKCYYGVGKSRRCDKLENV